MRPEIVDPREQYEDYKYIDLVNRVLNEGIDKSDRTGTGTRSVPFICQQFNLCDNQIPLLTTKKMFVRGIIHELLWYIAGGRNVKYLNDHNVHIWDNWADENGDLGPIYGSQWRNWVGVNDKGNVKHVDQLAEAIESLRHNPTDRGIIINSWNVAQLADMNLRPCHCMIQFWSDGKELRSHLYQRSCDLGLGVPFNIVQYSIFTHMIGQVTGLTPTQFAWTGGDVHIYKNHITQLVEQSTRDPYQSPTLQLNQTIDNIEHFRYDDFMIIGYESHEPIKMEVSV